MTLLAAPQAILASRLWLMNLNDEMFIDTKSSN